MSEQEPRPGPVATGFGAVFGGCLGLAGAVAVFLVLVVLMGVCAKATNPRPTGAERLSEIRRRNNLIEYTCPTCGRKTWMTPGNTPYCDAHDPATQAMYRAYNGR